MNFFREYPARGGVTVVETGGCVFHTPLGQGWDNGGTAGRLRISCVHAVGHSAWTQQETVQCGRLLYDYVDQPFWDDDDFDYFLAGGEFLDLGIGEGEFFEVFV